MKVYLRETSVQGFRERKKKWYVSFELDGKRFQKALGLTSDAGKREAEKRGIEVINETQAELKGHAGEVEKDVTIKDALDEYQRHLEASGSKWSINSIIDRLLNDEKFKFGNSYLVRQINQRDIDKLVLARKESGYSAQTIKHEIGVLRSACNKQGHDFIKLRQKTIPTVKIKTRAITVDEYKTIIAFIENDKTRVYNGGTVAARPEIELKANAELRDIATFLFFTGARWGEMCDVKWSDVDFTRNAVRLGTLKKSAGIVMRSIGMSSHLLTMMQARWEAVKDVKGIMHLPLFPRPDGSHRDDTSNTFIKVLDRAGLNADESIVKRHGRAGAHSFRHGFATLCIQKGLDIVSVSTLLGHSSLAMTQRYINHELGLVVNKVGQVLSAISLDEAQPEHV